jgi:hypothetical protein
VLVNRSCNMDVRFLFHRTGACYESPMEVDR